MSDSHRQSWDPWALPSLGLWAVYFAIGLEPERIFFLLRNVAGVVPQRAWVNSPQLITITFATFFAYFAFCRCREAGLSRADSQGRAIEFAVLGLAAFLWHSPEALLWVQEIPVPAVRVAVYLVIPLKVFTWLYLFTFVVRYYALGRENVFARIPLLFPSAHLGKSAVRQDGHDEGADSPDE